MYATIFHLQKVVVSFDSRFPLNTHCVFYDCKCFLEDIFNPIVLKFPYIPTTLLVLPLIINEPSLIKFNIISQVSALKVFT